MSKRPLNKFVIPIVFLCLLVVYVLQRSPAVNSALPEPNADKSGFYFDRDTASIIYSKHARCRMDCRKIDEYEIKEILQKGKINHAKSEPKGKPDPKFALEGITRDRQNVRVVFAVSEKGLVVVTCIDLDVDYQCSCN